MFAKFVSLENKKYLLLPHMGLYQTVAMVLSDPFLQNKLSLEIIKFIYLVILKQLITSCHMFLFLVFFRLDTLKDSVLEDEDPKRF